jgi:uncharacterized protein (TIGR02284 family)
MSLKNKEIVSILNDLIEVCKDGEQGYKDAADDVKDDSIKQMLFKYSEQRGRFYSELQYMVSKLGGEVEFGGSILGVLHRRWMDIRFGIAGSKTEAILNECIRGEKSALSAYRKALHRELPVDIYKIIEKQYNEISEACQNILEFSASNGFEIKVSIDFQ